MQSTLLNLFLESTRYPYYNGEVKYGDRAENIAGMGRLIYPITSVD